MALLCTVTEVLGRELDAQESELLQVLSPQGVAKVNADIAKGIDLEETLAQLSAAFQAAQLRKAEVESCVPGTVHSLVAQMGRPLTTEEMVLFVDVPSDVLANKIHSKWNVGELFEDVVEELADAHRVHQMQRDAKRVAAER
eukprot:RCo030770